MIGSFLYIAVIYDEMERALEGEIERLPTIKKRGKRYGCHACSLSTSYLNAEDLHIRQQTVLLPCDVMQDFIIEKSVKVREIRAFA